MIGYRYTGNLGAAWTAAEDDVIRALYNSGGVRACVAALSGRSRASVMKRAAKLGLANRRRWTDLDDAQLRRLWSSGFTLPTIAQRLQRTEQATYWRSQRLGLQAGVPQGCEGLSAAGVRTGFATSQLWRICAWAGLDVHRTLSRASKPRGRLKHKHAFRHYYVDPFDLDEAIAAWHRTETVHAAARARGLNGEALRAWLLEAGLRPPVKGVHWRVETTVIDRVVAIWRPAYKKKHRPAPLSFHREAA